MQNDEEIQERGCGMPRSGQMYFHIGVGPGGVPFQSFLLDPTIPVPEGMKIPDMGMLFVPRGEKNADGKDIYDIFDVIGKDKYPNVWDWIIEARKLGFHQLISTKSPVHLITPETLYFGVHARAGIKDPVMVQPIGHAPDCMPVCEKHSQAPGLANSSKLFWDETCIEFLTNCIMKGEEMSSEAIEEAREEWGYQDEGLVIRRMPSFDYRAYEHLDGVEYVQSIFIKIPLGMMAELLYYSDGSDEQIEKLEGVTAPDCMTLRVISVEKQDGDEGEGE